MCLGESGRELECEGVLQLDYCTGTQEQRKLRCTGVPQSQRHRHHWLAGSILQGHTKLNAGDVIGLAQAFSTAKSPETTAVDCGLERNGVRHMLDRLRIASALVAEHQRENVVFDNCGS